ncbi:MAG: divalent-cation tolerance protein CutA [Desulfomonilaceae bacterium]
MESYVVCFITTDCSENAVNIASILVQEKIAACVNIINGLRSIYWWKGKVCDEKETLMIVKTRASLFEKLKIRVKELHPYELPEIISIDISNGLPEYLSWINESTK